MTRRIAAGAVAAALACAVGAADAQAARRRSGGEGRAAAAAVPRDARFPYAGLWVGVRTMPLGADTIGLRFTVVDGRYAGETLHPDGSRAPQHRLAASAAGLAWEQPNSGGGTWVFRVRLAGPDSMAGTLVLRDPPPSLTPAPRGTLVLTRRSHAP